VRMSAAGEIAFIQERAKLAEAPVQLIQRELPQPQLANAGRVGHIAAAQVIERDQLGDRRRVAALAECLADIAGGQAQIRLHHVQQAALADIRLAHLGFVFQSNFLLPEFSALENVLMPLRRLGRLAKEAARERALELLHDLGLRDHAGKLPHQLSGGQNQRVAIARALANDPALILADEPTGNLDTVSSAAVQNILKNLSRQRGRTVVVVTHDRAFAEKCDRIIHIVDGRIVQKAA